MEFGVLGPLEVTGVGGPVNLKGTKLPALLGVLLLNSGVAVPVPRLIRALWDLEPPASATANLRTYIHSLRTQLARCASGAHQRLVSLPGGYRLDIEQPELDLLRFEKHATNGEFALRQGNLVTAEGEFAAAVTLWRGPAFDGLELCSWVRAKITSLEDRHWAVMSSWIDTRLAMGLHDEAVSHLRQMVAERPLSERAWLQLTAALYATGQTGEALAAFSTARRTLIEELGMEPGPQLCRLQEGILAGDADLVALATSSPAAPAVRATAAGPARGGGCFLPGDIRNFVEREDRVVIEAVRLLRPDPAASAPPIVALCGAPGIGKSSTAIHVAHQLREHYPDGQLYCASHGRTVDRILVELLGQLGVARHEIPGGFDERVTLYRALLAERRVLVVVDDVGEPAHFNALVPGPGPAAFLATSRFRLCGLNPGHVIHLGRMSEADSTELLASFAGRCRIDSEPKAAAWVVEICEGLPLALAIVGARLQNRPLWPLSGLAVRLADEVELDEFTFGSQSVRRVLDEAYQQQRADVQAAFRNLARLRTRTFTTDTIGRLLGVGDVVADRLAETLVTVSMIEALDTLDGREPVYRISRLNRTFGRELLARRQAAAAVPPTDPPRGVGAGVAVERSPALSVPSAL